jgi:two-component system, OmpR family, sensor histidine kinase CreC
MKIRTRLILMLSVSVVASVGALALVMKAELYPRYMEAQEEVLVDMAQTLAKIVARQTLMIGPDGMMQVNSAALKRSLGNLKSSKIDAQIFERLKTDIDIRIYVTDLTGIVVFDSNEGAAVGEDYGGWRDVSLTLKGQYGARVSTGDPANPGGDTMYVAAPVTFWGDVIGVVSVGKPTESIKAFIKHLLNSLAAASAVIIVIAFVAIYIINLWLSRPLKQLQTYAAAVIRNERVTLPNLGNNEVAPVGKAMEEMRAALDGKNYVIEYVQALTHELKTPIAAIRGASELLQEPMPEEHRQQFLGNIATQTERMQSLINRLLDLAALEHRNQLDDVADVPLGPLLAEVVLDLKPLADVRSIAITKSAEEGLEASGDRFLLSMALTNIIKNAIEFSPDEGNITVSAFAEAGSPVILVTDEGPGVPNYAIGRLTERFYALAKPDGQKSSGLGLSFVKEIADLHGATLTVANAEPHGLSVKLAFQRK